MEFAESKVNQERVRRYFKSIRRKGKGIAYHGSLRDSVLKTAKLFKINCQQVREIIGFNKEGRYAVYLIRKQLWANYYLGHAWSYI